MKHLTKVQRYQISSYMRSNMSIKFISEELQVHKSTIYREIERNKTKRGTYNPKLANIFANERKERFASNRRFSDSIKNKIIDWIQNEQWSPEQISGYCMKNNIEMVSTERIYQYIREDKRVGGGLYKNLRHRLKHRKRPVGAIGKIKDRVSIDDRPKEVDTREEFGHFEMDLIVGKNHKGAVLTIIERKTRFFMSRYLPKGKNAKHVAKMIVEELLPYKRHVKSITTDNGLEFAEHKLVQEKLDTDIYFAHPYCSWEKGQIEYGNKLLRQYILKREEINEYNTKNIKKIQAKINRRPRKNLNYEKPVNLFYNFIN